MSVAEALDLVAEADLGDALVELRREVAHGRRKHGPMLSYHDALARLTGEVEELNHAVLHDRSHDRPRSIRLEAVQVAAMALRLILENE